LPTVFPLGHAVLFVDTVAPSATDDQVTIGVRRGNFWLNTTNNNLYVCVDSAESAAEWKECVGAERQILTENGITGGGNLSSDLTLSLTGSALHLHQYTEGTGTAPFKVPKSIELGGAAFLDPIPLTGVFSAPLTTTYQTTSIDYQ